jgi:methionyl-tRNA synthetase
MVVIERSPDQGVQIGRYTLRVLAVRADEVVVALLDPDRDCAGCGERAEEGSRCAVCGAVVCPRCARPRCPRCASFLG